MFYMQHLFISVWGWLGWLRGLFKYFFTGLRKVFELLDLLFKSIEKKVDEKKSRPPINWFLKDFSKETSLESFVQTGTIIFVISGFWIFVFSRTFALGFLDILGINPSIFNSPPVYEVILGVIDGLLLVWQRLAENWAVAVNQGMDSMKFYMDTMGLAEDQISPSMKFFTSLGFSPVSAAIAELPLTLLVLLVVSVVSVGAFKTAFSFPVIIVCVSFGAYQCREWAVVYSTEVAHALIKGVFYTDPAYTTAGGFNFDPMLSKPTEDPRWFSAARVAGDVRYDFSGILLVCIQNRCLYIPAGDSQNSNHFFPDRYSWNSGKGLGILFMDENILFFNSNSTSHIQRVAAAPAAAMLRDNDFSQAYATKRNQLEKERVESLGNNIADQPMPVDPATVAVRIKAKTEVKNK